MRLSPFSLLALVAVTGCGPHTITTSDPPDAADRYEAGTFVQTNDAPVAADRAERGGQQPRQPPADANRTPPMMQQVPMCPPNPQDAPCAVDGGQMVQACRVQERNNLFGTCFCVQGSFRCPGILQPPPPRPDGGDFQRPPRDAAPRPDASTPATDATRG